MPPVFSTRFGQLHPLLYRFVVLAAVSFCVYFLFRYFLIILLPFIIAYLLMRMLFPIIWFLQHKWHVPGWLAYGGTLTAFFSAFFGGLFILGWQFFCQLKLFLKNFGIYKNEFIDLYERQSGWLCGCVDRMFDLSAGSSINYLSARIDEMMSGAGIRLSKEVGMLVTSCVSGGVKFMTILLIILVSMIALCKDMQTVHKIYRRSIFYPAVHKVALTLKKSGFAYLKSQGIIFLIIWFVCSVSIAMIRNPYSILIGCGIAVFDTFPVLGSGMILVPWSAYYLFQQDYYSAVILLVAFILCVLVRDLLEAHLMGSNMGLLPFFMTAALYGGVCLFGVWGILLGPFGVVLIRSIYEQIIK